MSFWDKLFQQRKEKQQREFDLVSKLVEETFGRGFKPDYLCVPDNEKLCVGWKRVGYPAMIARPESSDGDFLQQEDAGYFVRKENSTLIVNEEYVKSGLTYARRYEEETGMKIILKIARLVPRDGMSSYETKEVNLKVVQ